MLIVIWIFIFMASLYRRRRSPFWWIKFRDAMSGRVRRQSTGFRVGFGPDTRKARERAAELSFAEFKSSSVRAEEFWGHWVQDYLHARYSNKPLTLARYLTVWRMLSLFLNEKDISAPRFVTRELCLSYLAWRLKPNPRSGKYPAGHNTARLELKVLGMLMAEAVRREFASVNPCRSLGVTLRRTQEKPELTPDDIEFLRLAIDKEPEPRRTFFARSFEIARYQGCRLSETHINPLTDVHIESQHGIKRGVIRFLAKGDRLHVAPLCPELFELFEKLQADKLTETYPRPRNASQLWFRFLHRCGMKARKPGACFHSLRVTAATRMVRANVSEAKAMKFLGHASTTVHRLYQRLLLEDLQDCLKAMGP